MEDEQVIIGGAGLYVEGDNYEEFDQELNPEKFGVQLVQSNTLKGTRRTYQFYADKYLLLDFAEKKRAKEKKFRVNLAWLASEPIHRKVVVWKWLYAALASSALLGLFIFLAVNETIKLEYSIVGGTITTTASLIFLLVFIYQMRNEYIFKSQFGNARLFLIENKKPDQAKFDNFFINLQQAIEKAKVKISVSDRLVGELKMCRRLRDENIINDKTYTIARTAIFKHEQYKT